MMHDTTILKIENTHTRRAGDRLAIEEPLDIQVGYATCDGRQTNTVSITMRSPGHDFELAAGFLFTEGVITSCADIDTIRHCGRAPEGSTAQNTVRVDLRGAVTFDPKSLERHFYTTSSCGICGKTSMEAVRTRLPWSLKEPRNGSSRINRDTLFALPETMRSQQAGFAETGGVHGAGLFTADGAATYIREDVGRHNAVDKVIGAALMENRLPLDDHVLLLSGRAGFELVQKAAMAGIPIVAAVGAPTNLAVRFAQETNMTLIGFLRDRRCNIYSGEARVE